MFSIVAPINEDDKYEKLLQEILSIKRKLAEVCVTLETILNKFVNVPMDINLTETAQEEIKKMFPITKIEMIHELEVKLHDVDFQLSLVRRIVYVFSNLN